MNDKVAHILSIVLHPAIMPTLSFAILLFQANELLAGIPQAPRLNLLGLILFSTFIIPATSLVVLYKANVIKSLTMEKRQNRLVPFIFTAIFYTVLTYIFFDKLSFLGKAVPVTMGGVALSVCLMTVITLFYKISAHMVGVGGLLGLLIALQLKYHVLDLFYPILLCIIALGGLMTARLRLKAHTMSETLSGFVLGLCVCAGLHFLY